MRDASPIVWNLRKYKSASELATLREAARIGVEGHKALIRSTRPGVTEHALSAVFDFVTALNGAHGLAYYTIIMSGKNHAYGHYHAYDRTLADGDFLILDAGPAYRTTTSTSRRRFLLRAASPRASASSTNPRSSCATPPSTPIAPALLSANHSIGLATHDVIGTFAGPDEVLQPGFVFACDIQLFRLDEQIGIRIEDTVAITDTCSEVLSRGLPRTVDEIEALMQEEGILQTIRR